MSRTVADAGPTGGVELHDEIPEDGPVRRALSRISWRLHTGELGVLPVMTALVLIWAVFTVLNPKFLTPHNVVDISRQSVAVGTIALGVVLVLLVGEIDLSVGSVYGLASAVLAVGLVNHGWPLGVAVVAALLTGGAVGTLYGVLFTRFGIPSFVLTLGGLMAYQGLQIGVLGSEGTINIPHTSELWSFAVTRFLPPAAAYAVVVLLAGTYVGSRLTHARRREAVGLPSEPVRRVLVRATVLVVLGALLVTYLGRDRGVSYAVVLFVALVVVVDVLLRRTRWGRSIFAIGGNVDAARRAGIAVPRIYVSVFALCSTLAALGGILGAGRLGSVGVSSGGADTNLNAIAAAIIGGTSLFGGRGSAWSAMLGVLVITSISNGLNLVGGIGTAWQLAINGIVLVLAVGIDSVARRSRAAKGRA